MNTKKIYLDYASTTPVDARVFLAMKPYFLEKFGNAGSLHSFGQEAIKALDDSRTKIAKLLNVDFREIIFTPSATIANNLVIRGVIKKFILDNPDAKPEIIVSKTEHDSVWNVCKELEKENLCKVKILSVGKNGIIKLDELKKLINKNTALVSVMLINNESGIIQPVINVGKIITDYKVDKKSLYPMFHSDAVQGVQIFNLSELAKCADFITTSSHKIYGPKGAAGIFIKKSAKIEKTIFGGGQEYDFCSGTENVPAIVGFAKAFEIAQKNKEIEFKELEKNKKRFLTGIKKVWKGTEENFSSDICSPHILNIYLPGKLSEEILTALDLAGISASSGSACSARSAKTSRVLSSCEFSEKRIKSSVRFSFGRFTDQKQIDETLRIVKNLSKR